MKGNERIKEQRTVNVWEMHDLQSSIYQVAAIAAIDQAERPRWRFYGRVTYLPD